ncbi:uncharacterized protein C2orf81 homolog isoform X2 [Excalfactoria chinensis]|uniref:uncharacterized protein C2orf81 homolog isoform X2 n=1 Tax=Excalfactoria chinensis TaxID=46218 RepID=UPI003B3B84A9
MATAAPSDDVKERRAVMTTSRSAASRARRCRGDRDAARRGGCAPFAVHRLTAELLRAAAWRFLVRDEGDAALEALGAWTEDEEPPPGAADSWTEGAVPVLTASPTPRHGQVSSPDADAAPSEAERGGVPSPFPWPWTQDEMLGASLLSQGASGSSPMAAPLQSPLRPGTGRRWRLPSIKRPKLQSWTGASDETEDDGHGMSQPSFFSSLMRIWALRCLCSEVRDRRSTIPGTTQPDPSMRWVQPQVEVLDPGAETKWQPRPPRRRREPRGPSGQNMGPGGSCSPRGLLAMGAPRLLPPIVGAPQPSSSQSLALGSLLGTVQLAPGVTIRHGGSEGHRLCLPVHREDTEKETGEAKPDLRPLRPTVPCPAIAGRQVSSDGTPSIQ